MNRFTYDNIHPLPSNLARERAAQKRPGINHGMSKQRRVAKQSRHRANQSNRLEQSRNNNKR